MDVGRSNKNRDLPRAAGGFTLVELLVVMTVIAILAAIAFPVYTKAREGARVTQCLSNMRQIGAGLRMYTEDSNGRMPTAVSYGSPSYWQPRGASTIQQLLSRYVGRGGAFKNVADGKVYSSPGVFACPSDSGPKRTYAGIYGISSGQPVWKSTGSSYEYYSSNQEDWAHSGLTVPWTSLAPVVASASGRRRVGAAVSDIVYPSRKAVIGDLHYWHYGDRTPDNHLAFCNTLFADGHAARVKGYAHLEARLERLRPWHTATEIEGP